MMTTTMATLKGSEKQIAWATDIRERMIASAIDEATSYINDKARSVAKGQMTQAEADQLTAKWEIAIEMMGLEDTAKWWIDNRYKNGRSVRDSLFITPEMIAEHCAAKAQARAEAEAAAAAIAAAEAEAAAAAEAASAASFNEWLDQHAAEDLLIAENEMTDADYADDAIEIYSITDALTVLGAGYWRTAARHQAAEMVADAVNIELGDEYDVDEQELYDWIYEGSYTGPETIRSLAQEWRAIDADWDARAVNYEA